MTVLFLHGDRTPRLPPRPLSINALNSLLVRVGEVSLWTDVCTLATPHTPTTPAAGTWNNGNFPFHLPTMWENQVQSLGWEDPLEKEMAIHSSILAWRIPRTEEPGGLQSVGLQRVAHDWATPLSLFLSSNLACLLAFEQWVAGHCPSTPHTNSFQ